MKIKKVEGIKNINDCFIFQSAKSMWQRFVFECLGIKRMFWGEGLKCNDNRLHIKVRQNEILILFYGYCESVVILKWVQIGYPSSPPLYLQSFPNYVPFELLAWVLVPEFNGLRCESNRCQGSPENFLFPLSLTRLRFNNQSLEWPNVLVMIHH